ncbi:MAG: hypothetical protein IKH16_10415 [Selenomonadaceae bacterium]|nr:hypothetical protein [Selenomonadaceae bacterium]
MNEEQRTGNFFEECSRGRIHFENLLRAIEFGRYDDAYLEELIEYHRLYPLSEKFDVFYAKYAMAHNNYPVALEYAWKAYEKRKASAEIWKLLVKCHEMLGNSLEIVFFQGLLKHHYEVPLRFQIPGERLEEYLAVLTRAFDVGHYAPFHLHEAFWRGDGLEIRPSISFCEYICGFVPGRQESLPYAYWVGAYAEEEDLEGKTCLLEANKGNESLVGHCGAGVVFDIMKFCPGFLEEGKGNMSSAIRFSRGRGISCVSEPKSMSFICGQFGRWNLTER